MPASKPRPLVFLDLTAMTPPCWCLGALMVGLALLVGCASTDAGGQSGPGAAGQAPGGQTSSAGGGSSGSSGQNGKAGAGLGGTEAGGEGGVPIEPWSAPSCDQVSGTSAVTFTRDGGTTFAQTSGKISAPSLTDSLIALPTAGHLLAVEFNSVLRSIDAGCSWTKIGLVEAGGPRLVAAGADRAYGYGLYTTFLSRFDGEQQTLLPLPTKVDLFMALGADARDPDRLRVVGESREIFESTDGGHTFSLVGQAPVACRYPFVFDPTHLEHAFCVSSTGLLVTFDGGSSWQEADLGPEQETASQLILSPTGGQRVWAITSSSSPSTHWLSVSDDGGRSFRRLLKELEAYFPNSFSTVLATDPLSPEVLYMASPTTIYRYSLSTGAAEALPAYPSLFIDSMQVVPSTPPTLFVGVSPHLLED